VIGVDGENPYDVLAINAASAALMLSGIPFEGPIGAVRIAWSQRGQLAAPPHLRAGRDATFELVVAGASTMTTTSPS
jgi:polyribonucleotide nucleotidyltransferase